MKSQDFFKTDYRLMQVKSIAECYTPAFNLGYLAPPGQFFMGTKLFIGTPWMGNEGVLKNWFWICEIAWFLWQLIANLRRGVCLQNYSYLSCYLS